MPSGNTSIVTYSTTVINQEFRIILTGYEIPYMSSPEVTPFNRVQTSPPAPVSELTSPTFNFNPLDLDTGSEISVSNLNFVVSSSLGVTSDVTDRVDEQTYVSSENSFGNGPVTRIDRR